MNESLITEVTAAIQRTVRHPWRIMEICGGQTHAIARYGIEELLPEGVTLLHGPGCPVCVTPTEIIEKALQIAVRKEVIFCSFGDMLRVPCENGDLLSLKSKGADVRMLYSPLDALAIARSAPEKEVVFLAVGFETTAPVHALAVLDAQRLGLRNFTILPSLFTVPPAIENIAADPACRVDGFLAAGHVCTVEGYAPYETLARRYGLSIGVTGFEPLDLLLGIYHTVHLLEKGEHRVYNAYPGIVNRAGNPEARQAISKVFEPCDREWRGMGLLPRSGLKLRKAFEQFDAIKRFNPGNIVSEKGSECRAGDILKGITIPLQCPLFGTQCTPEYPQGALMVSSEGACAAYYRYRRTQRL